MNKFNRWWCQCWKTVNTANKLWVQIQTNPGDSELHYVYTNFLPWNCGRIHIHDGTSITIKALYHNVALMCQIHASEGLYLDDRFNKQEHQKELLIEFDLLLLQTSISDDGIEKPIPSSNYGLGLWHCTLEVYWFNKPLMWITDPSRKP